MLVEGRGHQARGHNLAVWLEDDRVALRCGPRSTSDVTHAAEGGVEGPVRVVAGQHESVYPLAPVAVPTSTIAPLGWTRRLLPVALLVVTPAGVMGVIAMPLVPNDRSRVPLASNGPAPGPVRWWPSSGLDPELVRDLGLGHVGSRDEDAVVRFQGPAARAEIVVHGGDPPAEFVEEVEVLSEVSTTVPELPKLVSRAPFAL